MHDIAVIGGGPAGLMAAVYAKRAGKSVLVLEKDAFGGQVNYSPKVENAPGFESVSGAELAGKMVRQAEALGAELLYEAVTGVSKTASGGFELSTADGKHLCRALVIATGAKHRRLGLEREEEYIGNGVSFCAACDGAFYEGGTAAVVGGGNSALQEALLLSEICKEVYVVQNLPFLTGEASLRERLSGRANVAQILGTVVTALHGEGGLDAVTLRNVETGEERRLAVDVVFVAVGLEPQNGIFADLLRLEGGYIAAGESCFTSARGVFAAGDCRTKSVRQIVTAASDGAAAALAACAYIDSLPPTEQ